MNIHIVKGDITQLQNVECIVNAANTQLGGGSGVNGVVQRNAGPALLKYCENTFPNGIETGEAVLTPAFNLPYTKYIMHTAGPIYRDGMHGEPEQLENCYYNSLLLANMYGIKSIAFPCLSTGIYGYPLKYAAKLVYDIISNLNEYNFLNDQENQIEDLIFCCFDDMNCFIYHTLFEDLL